MNRLWVQFSLAITLAIILVTLSPLALFFFRIGFTRIRLKL